MFTIQKRILKDELKYKNTVILTYSIEYPEIILSSCIGINNFNRYNKQKAFSILQNIRENLYQDAIDLYEYNTSNGYPIMVFEVISQYTITYNSNFIISLYSDKYEFTGGAHGNTIRTSQTWNLCTGNMLPLSYFYPNSPYYIINILKSINKQIEPNKEYYFDNYCQLVLETINLNNFYLKPNNIAIYFQQYDIAPYSTGIPVFYIQYK